MILLALVGIGALVAGAYMLGTRKSTGSEASQAGLTTSPNSSTASTIQDTSNDAQLNSTFPTESGVFNQDESTVPQRTEVRHDAGIRDDGTYVKYLNAIPIEFRIGLDNDVATIHRTIDFEAAHTPHLIAERLAQSLLPYLQYIWNNLVMHLPLKGDVSSILGLVGRQLRDDKKAMIQKAVADFLQLLEYHCEQVRVGQCTLEEIAESYSIYR